MSRVDKEVGELWREHPWLLAITLAALLFGVYARFKGLATWPLTSDEYYIARSVQNILRTGIPAYDCGGYYPRGLLMQYLAAALQLGGLSAELAPRLIAALCSLAALPAVYILGKRVHSSQIGLLAVTVLALSVWEVEIARFGRMYAPFQAVFAWYMVYFLKYTMDRDHRALWPMLALSIVGALTWEGAALLALVNFLPPIINHSSGRLSRSDAIYLAGTALLFLLIAWFATLDVRVDGSEPPYPADYDDSLNKRTLAGLEPTVAPWTTTHVFCTLVCIGAGTFGSCAPRRALDLDFQGTLACRRGTDRRSRRRSAAPVRSLRGGHPVAADVASDPVEGADSSKRPSLPCRCSRLCRVLDCFWIPHR